MHSNKTKSKTKNISVLPFFRIGDFTLITAQKLNFSIKDFFSKNPKFSADLVTFTEEIFHGKLYIFVQWNNNKLIFQIT